MAFTRMQKEELVYFSADNLRAAGGVAHGFSTRLGGVSVGDLASLNLGRTRNDDPEAVHENHRRFAAAIGSDLTHMVLNQQVHSNIVRVVTKADALKHFGDLDNVPSDGMVTDVPGLLLGVFYADCIPVLFYDPRKKAIGAVHSGWRGTAGSIACNAVEAMVAQYGSDPADILAAIGPGIGPECFETHRDVPDALAEAIGAEAFAPFVQSISDEKYLVDLKGVIRHQLMQSGLTEANISALDLCTMCNLDLFWSHRKLGEARGNQAAMIQLLAE